MFDLGEQAIELDGPNRRGDAMFRRRHLLEKARR
jgi:hypothetical protein